MENIADYYYDQLETSTNPGVLLAGMYSKIFDIKLEAKHYMMFNKLVRLYDRFLVFNAILVMAGIENVNHEKSLFPLFTEIISRKYGKRVDKSNIESKNNGIKIINDMEKKIKELAKNPPIIPDGEFDE